MITPQQSLLTRILIGIGVLVVLVPDPPMPFWAKAIAGIVTFIWLLVYEIRRNKWHRENAVEIAEARKSEDIRARMRRIAKRYIVAALLIVLLSGILVTAIDLPAKAVWASLGVAALIALVGGLGLYGWRSGER